METSKTSTGEPLNDLTLFAGDTPANHSLKQENEEEKMIQDTCGRGSETPLANYDLLTQSWRMFEDISLWGDYKSLESLPKSGMTRSGVLYQQPVWVRPIDAIESSLWPTPTTQEVEHPNAELTPTGRRKSKNNKTSHSLGLADAVQMWPTPVSSSSMAEDISTVQKRLKKGKPYKSRLIEAVAKYPTPIANGMAGGSGAFNKAQSLEDSGQITKEKRIAIQAGNGGKLNPMWVEWLMGFPLGWTDLEE
jgi:hypothetical protein